MTLILCAALFLPLFPFSIVLNWLLMRLTHPALRFLLLLVWPQIGVGILTLASPQIPDGMVLWALFSALFYALRLVTVRDLGLWAGFIASSALALIWGLAARGGGSEMHLFALWFSLPAALLALLTGPLTDRFGAAFAGLHGGLVGSLPRLSGVLIFTALAAIATPPSPGFFAMLILLNKLDWHIASGVLIVWLLWGWAATRMMQGFLVGEESAEVFTDISKTFTMLYASLMVAFVVTGLLLTGGML